jgi:hypothetical protein
MRKLLRSVARFFTNCIDAMVADERERICQVRAQRKRREGEVAHIPDHSAAVSSSSVSNTHSGYDWPKRQRPAIPAPASFLLAPLANLPSRLWGLPFLFGRYVDSPVLRVTSARTSK